MHERHDADIKHMQNCLLLSPGVPLPPPAKGLRGSCETLGTRLHCLLCLLNSFALHFLASLACPWKNRHGRQALHGMHLLPGALGISIQDSLHREDIELFHQAGSHRGGGEEKEGSLHFVFTF